MSLAPSHGPAVLTTRAGVLRGQVDAGAGLARFRGVPYAAAPTGELRFREPVRHPGWEGERAAIEFGATPLLPPDSETSSIPEPTTPGEEILNLNITAPLDAAGPLPVYVWIHGGGYLSGTPNGGWFDGASMARTGVVVVSITYRLGIEGFGHIPGAPDNRGVLDCIAALRWVAEEIAGVGGDPDRVTVGGQSAGGGLVLALLASPAARGLFRGAVIHSAPLPDIDPDDAGRLGARLSREHGVANTLAGWQGLSREQLAVIDRQLDTYGPWSSLGHLHRALSRTGQLTQVGPIVGTDLIPDPLPALAASDDRPVMIGSTSHEFNLSTAPLEQLLGRTTPTPVLGAAGLAAPLARAYPRAYPGLTAAALLGQALSDRVFRMTVLQVAGARERAGAPVAVWDFRWHPTDGPARHCIDLPFAWDALDGVRVDRIAGERPPAALATEMSGDIATFVRSAVVPWQPFTNDAPVAKVYDETPWLGRDPYRFERLGLEVI
ncbi:carboxylesterase/lipase family protein [Pseudactinotalea terrae]|uniref:carboxylesterase/lipase family protein n=1 Tax=Pseudactinotalea terrae TaxID=1743262 RepID=UPI001390CAF5|nr:carboxylesterase family protein [Pseudactinotalea terrae]